jgi:hypothetical protein
LAVSVDYAARGGAATKLSHSFDGIQEISGAIPTPLPAGKQPTVFLSLCDVEQPRGAIPRQVVIPLVVRIDQQDVAQWSDRQVVGITKSMRENVGRFSIRRKANDCPAARVFDWRRHAVHELPVYAGVVSAGEINPTIRTPHEAVGPVFAVSQPGPNLRRAIGLIVPVGVPQLHDGVVARANQVSAVKEHPVGTTLWEPRKLGGAIGRSI